MPTTEKPKARRYQSGSVTFEAHQSRGGVLITNIRPAGPLAGAQVKASGVSLKMNARVSSAGGQLVLSKAKLTGMLDVLSACEDVLERPGTPIDQYLNLA